MICYEEDKTAAGENKASQADVAALADAENVLQ
jgi:hypothetical protein